MMMMMTTILDNTLTLQQTVEYFQRTSKKSIETTTVNRISDRIVDTEIYWKKLDAAWWCDSLSNIKKLIVYNIIDNYSLGGFPLFSSEMYESPKLAGGGLSCATCHTGSKDIEVSSPQSLRPDSTFDIVVQIKSDGTAKQIGPSGKRAGLKVAAVAVLPPEIMLETQYKEYRTYRTECFKRSGLSVTPYREGTRGSLVVNIIPASNVVRDKSGSGEDKYPTLWLPLSTVGSEEFGVSRKTDIILGGNIGRGQVYPTGERSNNTPVISPVDGRLAGIIKGKSSSQTAVSIVRENGRTVLLEGLPDTDLAPLTVEVGQYVQKGDNLTANPNAGGFGQATRDLGLQEPVRLKGMLLGLIWTTIANNSLLIKKKQFQKVQELEICG
jgi:apocytochrome f